MWRCGAASASMAWGSACRKQGRRDAPSRQAVWSQTVGRALPCPCFPVSNARATLLLTLPACKRESKHVVANRDAAMNEPQTVRTETPSMPQPGLAPPAVEGKYVY